MKVDKSAFYSPLYMKASEYIFHSSRANVFVRIARAIVDKIDEFPYVNIEELAKTADTTPPSVTKFSRLIGYASYTELKNDIVSQMCTLDADALQTETEIINDIYSFIPMKKCQQLANVLSLKKSVLILTNEFSFSISNILKVGISSNQRKVYTVDRTNHQLISFFMAHVDCVVIITLTGEWMEKDNLLNRFPDRLTLCLISKVKPKKYEGKIHFHLSLDDYTRLLCSNYHSHKYLESIVFNIAQALL